MVRDHYGKLGFALESEEDGRRRFTLPLVDFSPERVPMEVVHLQAAEVLARTVAEVAADD
jgi:hypothetical protein